MPEVEEPPNLQEGNYIKGKRSELSVVRWSVSVF